MLLNTIGPKTKFGSPFPGGINQKCKII